MDQCCGLTGSIVTSELLENGCKPVDKMSHEALASLLQVLFVYEASFLDGASLMETVHQCSLMWYDSWPLLEKKEEHLTVKIVLTFIKSLTHSLGSVFNGVMAADIYEGTMIILSFYQLMAHLICLEEDFQGSFREYLGYDFVDSAAVETSLTDLIARLESEAASFGESPSLVGYLSCMLAARLQLQKLFLLLSEHTRGIITEYNRVMKRNQRNAGSGTPKEVVSTTVETHLNQCADVTAAATAALTSLKNLESYHHKLTASQGSQEQSSAATGMVGNLTTAKDRAGIQFAFCSTLAKLVQVSPVRFVPLKPFTESLAHLCKLCEEVVRVCSVSADLLRANQEESTTLTFEELCRLSLHLSAQRPHILARSFYYAIIHTQSAKITTMLEKSMLRRGVPSAVVTCDLVHQQWLDQNPFSASWESLKSFCINRNRYCVSDVCVSVDF